MSQLTGEVSKDGSESELSMPTGTNVSIEQESLIGKWTAKVKDSTFNLELSKDGRFSWTFTSKEGRQRISGVYAIQDSTLAMEPDGGGVMLAELHLEGTHLDFQQVGADYEAAPLNFERN